MRSPKGLGFRISIIVDRKFILFFTYLPLNWHDPIDQKHELARRLNENVFQPVFTSDQDENLIALHVLPFNGGLIAENLTAIVHRFGSMLEYVVQIFNPEGIIDLGGSEPKVGAC